MCWEIIRSCDFTTVFTTSGAFQDGVVLSHFWCVCVCVYVCVCVCVCVCVWPCVVLVVGK